MANPQLHHKTKVKAEDSSSLKGTLTAVLILGLFLIFSWFGVFYIFIDRF
ncbi:cytochrome c oxidase subunit 2A [Bacillus salacetis]|uniref:Cytochrome c oxidase subunit 2A n=1 Tax=Bacillus salacetis TaxID=2315464 RepID=A0A3A1QZR5_9BACI|nr:cytochrome c oxidase subunit 2A [Bacillus salacetis]RIW33093.1 cytochrome c oxidase subunit 2A [Bacillus salacetis]